MNVPVPDNSSFHAYILVDLTVTDRGLLSGMIKFATESEGFTANITSNFVTGTISTDDDAFGCPFTVCTYTGVFQTAPVTFAGTPLAANCQGKSVSALAQQYNGLKAAVKALGYSSVKELQDAITSYCEPTFSSVQSSFETVPPLSPLNDVGSVPEPSSAAILATLILTTLMLLFLPSVWFRFRLRHYVQMAPSTWLPAGLWIGRRAVSRMG